MNDDVAAVETKKKLGDDTNDEDADEKSDQQQGAGNISSTGGGSGVRLTLTKKKKSKSSSANSAKKQNSDDWVQAKDIVCDDDEKVPLNDTSQLVQANGPLVIPVAPNKRTLLQQQKEKEEQQQQEQEQQQQVKKEESNEDGGQKDGQDQKISQEDEAAMKALLEQASPDHIQSAKNGGDNNKLVIGDTTKTKDPTLQQQQQQQQQKQQKQSKKNRDEDLDLRLDELPDEMPLDSDRYQRVPIEQFGAALLRGMGWTGDNDTNNSNNKNDKEQEFQLPRPHRLGLGATPKAMLPNEDDEDNSNDPYATHSRSRRRGRRPDEIQKQERLAKEREQYQRERERQIAMDKQRTIQNGSIVYILQQPKHVRARILQLVGVPGLNRVKILVEKDSQPTIVSRGSIEELVTRTELEQEPFVEGQQLQEPEKGNVSQSQPQHDAIKIKDEKGDRRKDDRRSSKDDARSVERKERDRNRVDQDDRRRHRDGDTDRERDRDRGKDRDRDRDRDKDRDRERRQRDKDRDRDRRKDRHGDRDRDEKSERKSSKKRRREDDDDDSRDHREKYDSSVDRSSSNKRDTKSKDSSSPRKSIHEWIIPQIRVRVVTEKLGRRHFKEKGVIVDVTPAGATIQMDKGGTILDKVPERYIETALPKPGGNAIVLTNTKQYHKLTKGRLLERNSRQGVLQVYEDGSVLTVPLDDMAEWCGPLDDDEGYL